MGDNPIATAYVEVRPKTEGFRDDIAKEAAGAALTIGQALATVKLGQFVSEGLREFEGARDVARQTEAVIRSTGGAAHVTEGQVASLSERLGELAAVDDDVIREGANLLLTFTNIRNEVGEGRNIFDRATEALVDMSAALGTDAPASAVQLGKALNDPIAGITALTRAGVSFTDQQKEQIRTLTESGDVVAAQGLILDELERQFGGSAEAQASALDRLDVALGDFKESIGEAVMPLAEQLLPVGERLLGLFENLPAPVQASVLALAGIAVSARPINEAVTLVQRLGGAGGETATLLQRIGPALGAAGVALGGLTASYGVWSAAQAGVNDEIAATGDTLRETFSGLTYSQTREAIEGLRDGVGGLRDDAHSVRSPLDLDYKADLLRSADAFDRVAMEQQMAMEAAAAYSDVTGQTLDASLDAVRGSEELARVLAGELTPSAGGAEAAMSDMEGAVTDANTALAETKTRAQEAADVLLGSFSTGLDAEEAALRRAEALADFRDTIVALHEGRITQEEYARAVVDTTQAVIDSAQRAVDAARDQAELEGRTLDATEEMRIYRGVLDEVAGTLAPGSDLRTRLEGYSTELANTEGSYTAEIDANTFWAEVAVANLQDNLNRLTQDPFQVVIDALVGGGPVPGQLPADPFSDALLEALGLEPRAGGGRVVAGGRYLVGERGPEVLELDQAGFVHANTDLARMGNPTPHCDEGWIDLGLAAVSVPVPA